jgi:hypothetical protein
MYKHLWRQPLNVVNNNNNKIVNYSDTRCRKNLISFKLIQMFYSLSEVYDYGVTLRKNQSETNASLKKF